MEEKSLHPHRFQRSGNEIEVYPSAAPSRPVSCLNACQKGGGKLRQALAPALAVVSGLARGHDMPPWRIPLF